MTHYLTTTLSDDRERRPVIGIGVPWARCVIYVCEHGTPQCLSTTDPLILLECLEGRCGHPSNGVGVDAPVRYQKRSCAGIKERTRQTREGFRSWLVAGGRVAGGKDDPVGIKFER